MSTTYATICWGQRYAVRADWAQASSPVQVRYENQEWAGDPHGRQVADFRHRPGDALREWILEGETGVGSESDADEAIANARWID